MAERHPHNPTFHRDATRARWAEDETRFGPGFTTRHAKLFASDMQVALGLDATRNSRIRAEADLNACGGDKHAAFALAIGRIDAALAGSKPVARKAA